MCLYKPEFRINVTYLHARFLGAQGSSMSISSPARLRVHARMADVGSFRIQEVSRGEFRYVADQTAADPLMMWAAYLGLQLHYSTD